MKRRSLLITLGLALMVLVKPFDVGAVEGPHAGNGYSCSTCHNSGVTPNSAGFNANCLSCHTPSGPVSSMPVTSQFTPANQGTSSHPWTGSDTNPAKGTLPPTDTLLTRGVTSYTGSEMACVRCHDPHNDYYNGAYLRLGIAKDELCKDCHRQRNVQRHNTAGSHPVYIGYSTSLRTNPTGFNANPVNANPGNAASDLNQRLQASGSVLMCRTCHGTHNVANDNTGRTPGVGGASLVRTNQFGAAVAANTPDQVNLCTNCHAGKQNHNANGQDIQCNNCHGSHVAYDAENPTDLVNVNLVRRIDNSGKALLNSATGRPYTMFFRYTSAQKREYLIRDSSGKKGICEGCHAIPSGSARNGSLHDGKTAADCTKCHSHNSPKGAFSANVTCGACHALPPTSSPIYGGVVKYAHKVTDTTCNNCHTPSAAASHNDGTIDLLTNTNACSACHSFPPASGSHATATTSPLNCATCHTSYSGFNAPTHNNGTVDAQGCNTCHGYPPNTQTIHTTGAVKYFHNVQNVVYTDCTVCHGSSSTHRDGTVNIITSNNACSSCHSYPPTSSVHGTATTSPANCTSCHIYTGYADASHNNGVTNFSSSVGCDTCHGYPPLSPAQISLKTGGAFANARIEDYAGGGGYHASHLLSTVTAADGFTPCLPCHPSGATHGQGGGTVIRANVNVFDAADTNFRFSGTRPKAYDSAATTCSNVSCHNKPSPAWKF